MKTYETPAIEVIKLEKEDIIVTSIPLPEIDIQ